MAFSTEEILEELADVAGRPSVAHFDGPGLHVRRNLDFKQTDAYRTYMREYMRRYRAVNGDRLRAQERERHRIRRQQLAAKTYQREYMRAWRAKRRAGLQADSDHA